MEDVIGMYVNLYVAMPKPDYGARLGNAISNGRRDLPERILAKAQDGGRALGNGRKVAGDVWLHAGRRGYRASRAGSAGQRDTDRPVACSARQTPTPASQWWTRGMRGRMA